MSASQRPVADPLERLTHLAVESLPGPNDLHQQPPQHSSVDIESATAAINALASAWSTFRLYPNPADQPGFRQAIKNLGKATAGGLTIEVGAGALTVGEEAFGTDRSSVEQLATRLFIHDVEHVTIASAPDPDELCQLFGLLATDREGARDMGGFGSLAETFNTLRLSLRGILRDDPDNDSGGDLHEGADQVARETEIARLIDEGANADEVHAKLLELSGGDDDKLRIQFLRAFREVHEDAMATSGGASIDDMLLPYRVDDIGPSPTGTFIEVYFRLSPRTRSEILEAFLVTTTGDDSRMFLDQFSGEELAEMVPLLSDEGFEALMGYAKATTEANVDDNELLGLLRSAREVRTLRVETSIRISDLVAHLENAPPNSLATALREQLTPGREVEYTAAVFRGLLAAVTDDRRFNRLAEIWAGRVRDRLHRDEVEEATQMLRAILDDPPYPRAHTGAVGNALAGLVTPELTQLAASEVGGDKSPTIEFLETIGSPAVRRVMGWLAVEEDAARRRHLIDLLAVLAREHPTTLLTALGDERWYVVRNVVAVLAKTGLPLAAEPIRQAAGHADSRVRVEALRGLVRLDNREAAPWILKALEDPESRVSAAALASLRSLTSGTFEKRLLEILTAGEAADSVLDGIAQFLVEHVPDSADSLRDIATRRFVMKATQRAGRKAARSALRTTSDE